MIDITIDPNDSCEDVASKFANAINGDAALQARGISASVEGTLVCRPGATPEFGVGHYRRVAALRAAQAETPQRALFFADPALAGPHCEGAGQSAERAAAAALALLGR